MAKITSLIDQSYFTIPSFTLECGAELRNVQVAYKTWGKLNETRDNVMIICHAFTGSADVEDWWGPLMGPGKAFDPKRYFIFCGNVLGSPYGTASPLSTNPDTGHPYGPEFPPTTIRDDVYLHKHVLDHLNVNSVAVVIGGSMGGMAVLEWPLCAPPGYVKHVIPLATSARHSAWCISWGEAQRQSIYSDPNYHDGYYTSQPHSGLAAARMSALLTYRTRDSFESRFGRKPQPAEKREDQGMITPPDSPQSHAQDALTVHNDGHRNSITRVPRSQVNTSQTEPPLSLLTVEGSSTTCGTSAPSPKKTNIFSAQGYLRYQGEKFTARFDANCYIHITRKLDSHDVSRDRAPPGMPEEEALAHTLSTLPPRALVIGIATDGLFTTTEQRELAEHIPGAELVIIQSPDGHDGFLLEFEQINRHVMSFLKREFPELYSGRECAGDEEMAEGFEVKKTSIFGEAEVDITAW